MKNEIYHKMLEHKRVTYSAVWAHVYYVLEQKMLISSDKSTIGCLSREIWRWGLTVKGHQGTFGECGNVLCNDCSGDNTGVYICQTQIGSFYCTQLIALTNILKYIQIMGFW
jgi:hypothetical protein